MEPAPEVVFGPFRPDPIARRLWRGAQEVALQPQPMAVLHYLVTHAGRIVTKEELLREVWAGTHVTKTALKVCVHAIRVALGDTVASPHYLATVGWRGYQFVGLGPAVIQTQEGEQPDRHRVVGREREVARLEECLAQARRGDRQLVFLTGEPGIGKTTVVDHWLARVRTTGHVRVGRGQCLEQYGEGEAYLPILEALGELWRAPGGPQVLEVLQRYAPQTWPTHPCHQWGDKTAGSGEGVSQGYEDAVGLAFCSSVLQNVTHSLTEEEYMPSREQESSSILSVRLPDELMQRLDRYLDWWETSRRVKSSRNAIIREALSQWLEVHEHEAGLVHLPILREQFQTAVRRLAHGPKSVPIARLRQVLPWPRARFDAILEALRAEHQVMLEEGVPGALSASEIHESYHVHGRLSSRLRWCD